MVDSKENYGFDLGVKGLNYCKFFTEFANKQKISLANWIPFPKAAIT